MMELTKVDAVEKVNLAGDWNYALDHQDNGLTENWYSKRLEGRGFRIPGTTALNQVGEELDMEPEMNKEAVRSLRQRYRYVGTAWYQRKLVIPKEWSKKVVHLFLERVMFESQVWLNDTFIGKYDSLSVPHIYNITKHVVPGEECTITIRIDNRDIQNIGPHSSAYTDETQTIWNGIVGKIELQAFDKLHINNVQLYPSIHDKTVKVKIEVDNSCLDNVNTNISVNITDEAHSIVGTPIELQTVMNQHKNEIEITYEMGEKVQFWSEFTPYLYTCNIMTTAVYNNEDYYDSKCIKFGMREFKAEGRQFLINDKKTFLRGTLDCCIYPLTGYPPTDKEPWLEIYRVLKDYGLNHLRFHSWCPPSAAFEAADEIGIYLNVEGPIWMDEWCGEYTVGNFESHYNYFPEEALSVIDKYGNHPSFCMYSNGNELRGDFSLLHSIIARLKERDSRRVYTLTTNWDREVDPADDYFAAQSVDGVGIRGQYFLDKMVEGTMLEFSEGVARRDMPVVSHEIGQYSVYPDLEEISLYNGVLKPINLETIKCDLEKKEMLTYAKSFMMGSGKLAAQLYKDEIEAALRTKDFGGFQLLDLHDFPGQSTATIGLLNSFWKSKGIISGEAFRRFCSSVVPLLRMEKRIYFNHEEFAGVIEVSHYGFSDIENATVRWCITNDKEVITSGKFSNINISDGGITEIGTIDKISFKEIEEASQLQFTITIEGTDYTNDWDLWVYPEQSANDDIEIMNKSGIHVANQFDSEVIEQLEKGNKVLLFPDVTKVKNVSAGKFFPVFWSPVHFVSKDPCGMVCDYKHPIFEKFPTRFYAQYQWKSLLENSFSMSLEGITAHFEPIVNIIPNFFNNHRSTNLFEAQVGKGKILVCCMNINNESAHTLELKQFRRSVLEYINSDKFKPLQTLTIEEIKALFIDEQGINNKSQDKDLALFKPSLSNSEKSSNYSASKGNDGNPTTCWSAADTEKGYWWQVDLGDNYELTSTKVTFVEEANYIYEIQVSNNGEDWRLVASQNDRTKIRIVNTDTFNESARFVRIIYNDFSTGIWAGHRSFEVFGQ